MRNVHPRLKVIGSIDLIVDFNMPFSEMIHEGNYAAVDSNIIQSNFPILFPVNDDGILERRIFLFQPTAKFSSEIIIKLMARNGCKPPASIPYLLKLGKENPNIQEKTPVISLGTICQKNFHHNIVPFLGKSKLGRSLGVACFDSKWGTSSIFIGLPKIYTT